MALTGFLGVLLGLAIFPFAVKERTRLRIGVFFVAYLLHIAAGFGYYYYSLSNVTDAAGYYTDDFGFGASHRFGFGTQFVHLSVQTLKDTMGGSMLDFFLFFQVLGFFGICVLMRMLEDIYKQVGVSQPAYTYLVLFLPGLHFWTSGIGKDGILFLSVCLAMWAAIDLRRRVIPFGLAILLMLLFRPHIALIAVAAAAVTLFFDRSIGFVSRSLLVVVALIALGASLSIVTETTSIDVTSADSVSNFLTLHERVTGREGSGGNSAVYGNFFVKLFALLFRPMFIDADGIFALIASGENVVLAILIAILAKNYKDTWLLTKRVPFARYAALVGLGLIFLLAMVYFNIGLGLRQKTMFEPCIIVLAIALLAVKKARAVAAAATETPPGARLREPVRVATTRYSS